MVHTPIDNVERTDASLALMPNPDSVMDRFAWHQRIQHHHVTVARSDRLLVLRPNVQGTATILPRRRDIERLVEAGERSVDAPSLVRIRSWLAGSAGSARVS